MKLDRHFKPMYLRNLLLVFIFVFTALVSSANAQPKEPMPRASAAAFKSLWNTCIKGTTAEAELALSDFKDKVGKDEHLSPQLRELLAQISLDADQQLSIKLNDNERHPAIGIINILSITSTFSKGRESTYRLSGRVSKDIEYGFLQQKYDSYLSEINAHNSLVISIALRGAPSLSINNPSCYL